MFSTRKKRTQAQSDSIDPPHHLYITPSHSKQSSSSSFPSLFQLATRACISHIHLFASLEGLEYNPFGEALYTEFLRRTQQWSLTTEQRRMAIFLFAEAYGDEFLGPEYSGLRCSLVQDIAYIVEFSPCLVYLDLSGSGRPVATANGSSLSVRSISDQDMAGLCSLTKLRILVLSGLKVGDTGLSHLIRGITHGSSGLVSLEYLDLSRTDITDVGISKIFVRAPSSRMDSTTQRTQVTSGLVFKKLLGIDLTGSKVHGSVASSLFVQPNRAREEFYQPAKGSSTPPWTRLDDQTRLFPISTTKEQQDKKHQPKSTTKSSQPRLYLEEGRDSNPMQHWVDRLNDLPPRLSFGKQPDLSGRGGMGLSESLALLKLDQVPSFTLPDLSPSQLFQQMVQPPPSLSRRQRRRRWEEPWAEEARSNDVGWTMPQEKPPGMEHMYNLVMYDRVLTTIRDTFGKLVRPTIPNGSTTTKSGRAAKRGPLYGPNDEEIIPQTLAFYRKRTVVKEYLKGLEEQQEALETALMTRNSLKGVIMESSSNAHHSERRGILDTSGVSMAKIRTKPNKSRPAGGSSKENNTLTGSSTLHTSLTLLDLSTSTNETFHSGHGDQKEFYSPLLQSTEPTHQPFVETTTGIPKKRKSPSSTLTLFSKTNQKKRLISVPTTRESLWHRGPSKNSDGRPKNPFVKSNNDEEERESLKSVEGLALDQETIAESRTKTATTHHSPAFTPIRGGSSSSGSSAACQPKPPTSSANLMMQWVQRKGKDPANNASGTSISSSTSTSISTPISSASDATPNQGGDSIIREFYFTEAPKKSVILDRWVHFSSSSSSSTLPRSREENEPRPFRNVIRVDRTSKLFSNHSDNDEQDPE